MWGEEPAREMLAEAGYASEEIYEPKVHNLEHDIQNTFTLSRLG